MFTTKTRRGFSLLEILIVVSLLSILLGMGVNALMKGRRRTQVRMAANEMKADLEFTKSQAKAENADIYFSFNSPINASNGYTISDSEGNTLKNVTFEGSAIADYTGLSDTELYFKSNGSTNADGTILITDGDAVYEISITQGTGMIKMATVDN
ncbi:MAG: GspH/FimT family pseudopilin [Vulcanimicrobiota bacterium]